MDAQVLNKLKKHSLLPNKPADKAQWLRRASLDLIGLPPTSEELHEFMEDNSLTAYETRVDRLLASPRFGERWASVWMDLARYSDTKGGKTPTEIFGLTATG